MFFEPKKDWKEFLAAADEDKLNELLKRISKHRGAYQNAEDVKNSQLWCAVLELHKENQSLQKRMQYIEDMLESMFEKVRKEERSRIELSKSLERF